MNNFKYEWSICAYIIHLENKLNTTPYFIAITRVSMYLHMYMFINLRYHSYMMFVLCMFLQMVASTLQEISIGKETVTNLAIR